MMSSTQSSPRESGTLEMARARACSSRAHSIAGWCHGDCCTPYPSVGAPKPQASWKVLLQTEGFRAVEAKEAIQDFVLFVRNGF